MRIFVQSVLFLLLAAPALFARPEFLARYAADPFARPELAASCSTCHVNPAGGGERNPFGRAFARDGFRVTPALRMAWPDRFLPAVSGEAPAPAPAQGSLKATWTAGREDEVLVEIAGEQYLLNRADHTVTKVTAEQVSAFLQPPAAPPAEQVGALEEPAIGPTFDYYLVNLPTTRARTARSLHLRFSHRFSDTAFEGTGRLRDLFGLDSFSVSSFGIEAGLTERVSFMTYRTPYARFVGGPTIEMGPIFQLLRQEGRSPVSLAFRATVEGQHNFTERFTTNLVPVVSRAIAGRAEIFVAPIFSLNVPRRTFTFDFPQTPGERRDHLVAIGNGISIRIRPRTAVMAEWQPRVAGFRGFDSRNAFAFGVQHTTGRHVFALTFANGQSSTTTRSLTDGRSDLTIGFNLYRRLF